MNKPFWQSKTFWGGMLLALESALLQLPDASNELKVVIGFLGIVLTTYGFRDVMNKGNKK